MHRATLIESARPTPPRQSTGNDRPPISVAPAGRGSVHSRLLSVVIGAAAAAGSTLPARLAHALAVAGGTAEWALRRGKRRRLATNLAHALGRGPRDQAVRRLVRTELQNEARRSVDLLWALGRPAAARSGTVVHGREHAIAALSGGSGMILAGIHLGGWEIAATVADAVIPGQITAVVADDWLAQAMEGRRRASGLRTVPRCAGGLVAARALQAGGTVLLLGDDAWGGEPRTHAVTLLDSTALLPAGIPALSRITHAPIVTFTFLPAGPRRWVGRFDPPLSPPAPVEGPEGERRVLQLLADRWSAAITAAPAHWAASFPIHWVGR